MNVPDRSDRTAREPRPGGVTGRIPGLERVPEPPGSHPASDTALLQAQHEQRLQAVGMLAAGIAHDFNNLLAAILGHASLLADSLAANHPERASLDEIIAGSQQAAALARRLLSFTRAEASEPHRVDLNDVARDAYALLRRVIGVDVELRLDLEPRLCRANADPAQIAQVLMNLILNARDALAGGRGHIAVRTRNAWAGSRGFAVLEVEDDGVGMDADVRSRLFEPFFSTKPRQGTGLGMAIVDAIVRRHEGHIAVESHVGQGTRIRVLLPAAEPGSAELI